MNKSVIVLKAYISKNKINLTFHHIYLDFILQNIRKKYMKIIIIKHLMSSNLKFSLVYTAKWK